MSGIGNVDHVHSNHLKRSYIMSVSANHGLEMGLENFWTSGINFRYAMMYVLPKKPANYKSLASLFSDQGNN